MIRNILLTIEYDGTSFSGWQIQPEVRTVQGELKRALSKICFSDIKIDGTSRTDAGVHALGQRASFKGEFGIPTERIPVALNNMLDSDIHITEAVEVPLNFHARFDAKGKKYIYKIMNCAEKNVFKRNFYYYFPSSLNVDKMSEAAQNFVGTHDFSAFMAMGSTPQGSTVRTIYFADVKLAADEAYDYSAVSAADKSEKANFFKGKAPEKEIWFEVKGNGFLYNMVRIMAGTLIEVGRGSLKPEDVAEIIRSKDRSKAGRTAPPQGLYLAEIYYTQYDLEI